MSTILEQVLPVVIKKKFMEPWGIGDGYDESEADAFYKFYQQFSNADGSGVLPAGAGTSTDPTTLANIQILDGKLRGVTSPTSSATENTNSSLLTTPIAASVGDIVIQYDLDCVFSETNDNAEISIRDSSGNVIFIIKYYQRSATPLYNLRFYTKTSAANAVLWSQSVTPPPLGRFRIVMTFNLLTDLLTVTSPDRTLTNNVDIDISDGGAQTSVDFKQMLLYCEAGASLNDTTALTFDCLKVY